MTKIPAKLSVHLLDICICLPVGLVYLMAVKASVVLVCETFRRSICAIFCRDDRQRDGILKLLLKRVYRMFQARCNGISGCDGRSGEVAKMKVAVTSQ